MNEHLEDALDTYLKGNANMKFFRERKDENGYIEFVDFQRPLTLWGVDDE